MAHRHAVPSVEPRGRPATLLGAERGGLLIAGRRFRRLLLRREDVAHQMVRLHVVWAQLERLSAVVLRARQRVLALLLRVEHRQIVVRLRIVGLELHRLLPGGRRALLVALRQLHGGEVVVDGWQRRVDRQHGQVVLSRLREVVRLVRGDRELQALLQQLLLRRRGSAHDGDDDQDGSAHARER